MQPYVPSLQPLTTPHTHPLGAELRMSTCGPADLDAAYLSALAQGREILDGGGCTRPQLRSLHAPAPPPSMSLALYPDPGPLALAPTLTRYTSSSPELDPQRRVRGGKARPQSAAKPTLQRWATSKCFNPTEEVNDGAAGNHPKVGSR